MKRAITHRQSAFPFCSLRLRGFIPLSIAIAALLFTAALHAEPLSPLKLSAIAPRMQHFVDEGRVAGAVTVVGSSKGIVHHEAVGYQNLESKQPLAKDALFRIASMTKPITAI